MSLFDATRAIVHMFTNGDEGNSPYVVSDIVCLLRSKYKKVHILEMQHEPIRFVLRIDDHIVTVSYSGNGFDDTGAFYALCDTCTGFIRFNPLRCMGDVTQSLFSLNLMDDLLAHVTSNWTTNWPRLCKVTNTFFLNDVEAHANCLPFLAALTKSDVAEDRPFCYMSEKAFVGAIQSSILGTAWTHEMSAFQRTLSA